MVIEWFFDLTLLCNAKNFWCFCYYDEKRALDFVVPYGYWKCVLLSHLYMSWKIMLVSNGILEKIDFIASKF